MNKVPGLRWRVIGLIGAATVINYIDRSTLAVMWPGIAKDLGLTKHDYATILSVFMVAYGLSQSLSGRLYDRIGTRAGFVVSIAVWSVAEACHGLARGLFSFGIFRGLLGFGEAGNWPGATKGVAEWFPIQERALAQGIFNAGASLGAIISPPLVALLYVEWGWKTAFAGVGAIGLLWIFPWCWVNRALPREHPQITAEELEHIVAASRWRARRRPRSGRSDCGRCWPIARAGR